MCKTVKLQWCTWGTIFFPLRLLCFPGTFCHQICLKFALCYCDVEIHAYNLLLSLLSSLKGPSFWFWGVESTNFPAFPDAHCTGLNHLWDESGGVDLQEVIGSPLLILPYLVWVPYTVHVYMCQKKNFNCDIVCVHALYMPFHYELSLCTGSKWMKLKRAICLLLGCLVLW